MFKQGEKFVLPNNAGPAPGGSVVLTLSNPAAVTANGDAVKPLYVFDLDGEENFVTPEHVAENFTLVPSDSFYIYQVFSGPKGTGSLVSIGQWIIAAAYAIYSQNPKEIQASGGL